MLCSCEYYTEEELNTFGRLNSGLSVIHFNSRSLKANFEYIVDVLHNSKITFNIITISESWMNADKYDEYKIKGYEFLHVDRTNKRGGGVAPFIHTFYLWIKG